MLADTDVLDTLSPREFRAGYAEVAKYGLIDRPDFFAWLEDNWRDVFAGGAGPGAGDRRVLPGQGRMSWPATSSRRATGRCSISATRSATRSRRRPAMTVRGWCMARASPSAWRWRIASRRGSTSPAPTTRPVSRRICAQVGLPWRISDIPGDLPDAERLLGYIAQDKKVSRGALTFILTRGIGQSFVAKDVPCIRSAVVPGRLLALMTLDLWITGGAIVVLIVVVLPLFRNRDRHDGRIPGAAACAGGQRRCAGRGWSSA